MAIKTLILRGPAGTGKTSLAEFFANKAGMVEIFYQCHAWTTVEELVGSIDLGKMALKDPAPYKKGPLWKAIELSKTTQVCLIIDEIDKSRESIDALFLDFIQNCRVETPAGEILTGDPANIVVFFTTNDSRELLDPLLRRGMKFAVEYLPPHIEASLLVGGDYYLDEKRQFILKAAGAAAIEVSPNSKLQGTIINIANKMREKDLDISLSELKEFYKLIHLCETRREVEFAIEAWLERTPDHADFIKTTYAGRKALAGSLWALMNKDK